ncbi:DUF6622 family protein [Thioclava sp.]|uniref:DUF6622 family protein n=1 Tax=Thioclava sp. TaxID=1933450 RepID=UPI003AA92249
MSHIPTYVYFLFAGLVWLGVKRLHARTIRVERLALMPVIFGALGLHGFFGIFPQASSFDLILAVIGGAAGIALGWLHAARWSVKIDVATRQLTTPGDPMLLVLILLIFAFEFALHYGAAAGTSWFASPLTPPLAAAIWAGLFGLSAGRNLNLATRFARANQRSKLANTGA